MTRYASEGIKAACDWAYKGVHEDSVLGGTYLPLFPAKIFHNPPLVTVCLFGRRLLSVP